MSAAAKSNAAAVKRAGGGGGGGKSNGSGSGSGSGHRLGKSSVPADKWRCSACSFLQPNDLDACGTCGEPRPPPRAKPTTKPIASAARTAPPNGIAKPKSVKPKPSGAAAAAAGVVKPVRSSKQPPKTNVHGLTSSKLNQTTAAYRAKYSEPAGAAGDALAKKIYTLNDTKLNGLNNPPIRHAPPPQPAAAASAKPKSTKPKPSRKPNAKSNANGAAPKKSVVTTIHDLPPAQPSAAAIAVAPAASASGNGNGAGKPTAQQRVLSVISDLQAAASGDVMPSLRQRG